MKNHTLQQRVEFYAAEFPKWPAPRLAGRWLEGIWIMGNDYRSRSTLYGAYPPNYLRRVQSMFPDADNILHLFSGSLPKWDGNGTPYTTFDIQTDPAVSIEPDIQGDAHRLSDHFNEGDFDLILADPPYSAEDAEHYGTCMVKRNTVLKECVKILRPGGYIVWLDQVMPMFRKKEIEWCGLIGMCRSTNHRFRMSVVFYKGRPWKDD